EPFEDAPAGTDVLWRSITFALVTAVIATPLGAAAAIAVGRARGGAGRVLAAALLAPLAITPVGLAVAYLVAAERLDGPLPGAIFVLAAHALVAYAFVLHVVTGVVRAMDAREVEAAVTLGASTNRARRRLEWPLLRRAMIAGAAFAFVVSLGEVGATLLLVQ